MRISIKFMAILFALAMQNIVATSTVLAAFPVYLHKYAQKETENPGPARVPIKNPLALSVVLDEGSQQLSFIDGSGALYSYYIYSEDGSVMSQGVLDFSYSDNLQVDLGSYSSGSYTLTVEFGGNTYIGAFELY